MKLNLKSVVLATAMVMGTSLYAQDCIIPVSVDVDEQYAKLEAASVGILENQLRRAATASGLNADATYTQFVITAKVDVLDKEVVAGPPANVVQNLGVTLYVADIFHQKTFVSDYVELKGVGKTEEKSLNYALKQLNLQNNRVKTFIQKGKARIIEYYDSQVDYILKDAERAYSMQNYEQAISLCASVPTCSKGSGKAAERGAEIYAHYRDLLNQKLLLKARAIWASDPDSEGAAEAAYLLYQIDPESSSYSEAMALLKEIKSQRRSDIDFERREKYWAENALEGRRIDAWRAVGVAVGSGPKADNHYMWLGR